MLARVLFVALSCLQGRPMRAAFDELAPLADGVQLTPGNHPTPAFARHVAPFATRTHHGFDPERRATRVWAADGTCLARSSSVHPPEDGEIDHEGFLRVLDGAAQVPCLETMVPGHRLGNGAELAAAMDRGLALAVDVSHLFIQTTAGVLDESTLRRLLDYDRIAEVHVSANDGKRDLHAPLDASTFGLAWARERLLAGTPVVLECYMHRMSRDDRRRQIDHVKGAA
jgi:hypothetical protein